MPIGSRDDRNSLICPKCKSVIKISMLKPILKPEYLNPDGTLNLSDEEIFRGGFAKKIVKGVACPKCGEIIGETV